jgi:hypothetical protein
MAAAKRRASCRKLFKEVWYSATSQRIPALIIVIRSGEHGKISDYHDSDVHIISRRYLHVPNTNLSKYQKGVYYSGIKFFSKLLPNIKNSLS